MRLSKAQVALCYMTYASLKHLQYQVNLMQKVSTDEIKDILVVDFSKPANLIDGRNALYVKSESIKSPMASNVAAFESNEDLDKMNADWNGILLSWGELQTQFK